ncbi:Predicted arabinose efflux permease, MFS family [Tistlia consotensis]|uniref:Predicted arabinose efflux permease, MFS family n=1 Tax=Tistlia consotensis USBA 355 TaxID=560819 RepID=A0A1Y6B917_9PROT|nr:MFS transporter [Tistlia consotensis]SME88122.1 Predicted arabinose efflux permease, MFS family [Tistlia consotensis USBA 355]SNR24495.1 Predicted arabinose efflux permease, MFS family [Tistlia consotensis]
MTGDAAVAGSAGVGARIGQLLPILVSAGILLAGNGVLLTLVAVRGRAEGFSEVQLGIIGAAYYVGTFAACLLTAKLIQRSGHIRIFAVMAAVAAVAVLTMLLLIDPWVWTAARGLMGLAFAGIATVIESWLNALADRGNRGRILSIYRIVDLSSVTGAQFLMPVVGAGGFAIFVIVAILYCTALIPVAASRLQSPAPPESALLRPRAIWLLSPVACAGCITIGLTNGAFRTLGPVYAQGMGFDVNRIALFMSLGIAAGALFQFPLGWLSDRFERRTILILSTAGAAAASLLLSHAEGRLIFAGVFLFGGFAFPLYSLSVAHASDHARPGQYVELSLGLTFFFSLGATVGPFAASLVINHFGPPAFWLYTSTMHGSFVVFVLYRMTRRPPVPAARRSRFVALIRSSPLLLRLTRSRAEDRP